MNFETHSVLKHYTVVAHAEENILDANDELDGSFIWVVYHNDSTHLFVGRVDNNSGKLQQVTFWPYRDARDYATFFASAMVLLYERSTGRDFATACPRS
jgi:hypothetical protein